MTMPGTVAESAQPFGAVTLSTPILSPLVTVATADQPDLSLGDVPCPCPTALLGGASTVSDVAGSGASAAAGRLTPSPPADGVCVGPCRSETQRSFVNGVGAGPSARGSSSDGNEREPRASQHSTTNSRTSRASSSSSSPLPSSSSSSSLAYDVTLRDGAVESPTEAAITPHRAGKRHSKTPLTGWLRAKVSQNKVRFREGNFDLDLTYITTRVIAMGYPAHGTEYYIRNPIDRVEEFFTTRHAQHFRVYNLCAERHYDRASRFQGRFKCFPFDDHNAPPLGLMCDFVDDAVAFLNEDAQNVVAIHCKAGKGRTGLMTCCLLLAYYPDQFRTAQEAIHFFDQKRTCDGLALTIPSQQRYVGYYEIILNKCGGKPPLETRSLTLREIRVESPALRSVSFSSDFYFTVASHNQVLLDSRLVFPTGPAVREHSSVTYTFSEPMPTLTGDIKLTFYRRKPFVLSGKESHAFYTWFNTNFCDDHIVLHRRNLDKVESSAAGKHITLEVQLQPLPQRMDFIL